ncbi:MAG: AAA+ superfamily predicted ATPase [Myxococcota bacterium]|jgi:AAA+ superfamily predicted ATPase
MLDYVQFIAPSGNSVQVSGPYGESVIRLLDWSSDPAMIEAHAVTLLVTENLADIHSALNSNPYAAKLDIKLPSREELQQFIELLLESDPMLKDCMDFTPEVLAKRVVGLSRVNIRNAIQYAAHNGQRLDDEYVRTRRRELIEKECRGLLDFIESSRTLDDVAGHTEARQWLRDDATLLKRGNYRSVPMGYLLCGRIGTGKTFLTTCWAGEIGIPFVVLKNFRDKWQGSTEGNLEKIFSILKALGQVLVFVDEADQATGKREGGGSDNGVGGRIYAMLAKEMSDTDNRGKIIWIFATSRPDLVEVDLKRPGRLDVHIPLFPPQDAEEVAALFKSMGRKVGVDSRSLVTLPVGQNLGGNEMEALLVRARRIFDLQSSKKKRSFKAILEEVVADFRPMAHTAKLEFMDLVAVKECTDTRFLPPAFRDLTIAEIDNRIGELKDILGER